MKKQRFLDILSKYTPQQFNSNEIEDLLSKEESRIIVFLRQEENKKAYDTFDADLSTFLSKIPESIMRKNVTNLLNKKLIFMGTSKDTTGVSSMSRVLITRTDKLAGVVLNDTLVNIKVTTGQTSEIDEAAFCIYSGIIRAALLLNKKEIRRNKQFHKNMSNYLYLLLLKVLGRHMMMDASHKSFLQMVVTYFYYAQYLEMKHSSIISVIEHEYVGSDIDKDVYDVYKPYLDKLMSFTSLKDFPKIVNTFKITTQEPSAVVATILKMYDKIGFYAIIGSLDSLVVSAILSKYNTELIPRQMMVSSQLINSIEEDVESYIKKIKYADEFANIKIDA